MAASSAVRGDEIRGDCRGGDGNARPERREDGARGYSDFESTSGEGWEEEEGADDIGVYGGGTHDL